MPIHLVSDGHGGYIETSSMDCVDQSNDWSGLNADEKGSEPESDVNRVDSVDWTKIFWITIAIFGIISLCCYFSIAVPLFVWEMMR